MLARLGGQGRVALGAIFGAALAALCCLGLISAHYGGTANAAEPTGQAVRGASAAAGALTPSPAAGVAAQAEVLPTTTTPPPVTTTTTTVAPPVTTTHAPPATAAPHTAVPTTKAKPPPFTFTFPTQPTFPKHHHPCMPWTFC